MQVRSTSCWELTFLRRNLSTQWESSSHVRHMLACHLILRSRSLICLWNTMVLAYTLKIKNKKGKIIFSSLYFHAIFTLVPIFYFHCFYILFRKTSSILVLFVNALTTKFYVTDKTIKIIINIYFGIKKCHVSI